MVLDLESKNYLIFQFLSVLFLSIPILINKLKNHFSLKLVFTKYQFLELIKLSFLLFLAYKIELSVIDNFVNLTSYSIIYFLSILVIFYTTNSRFKILINTLFKIKKN